MDVKMTKGNKLLGKKLSEKIAILVLMVVSAGFFALQLTASNRKTKTSLKQNPNPDIPDPEENELDGCYHVYLDVGSNRGIQVRKLFESELYPNATMNHIFDYYFGPHTPNRNHLVCSVGFEPNFHHTKPLQDLEAAHKACGWKTHFFTETAAGHDYRFIDVYAEIMEDGNTELGATIIGEKKNFEIYKIGTAKKIRLADYVLQKVITRRLPKMENPLDSTSTQSSINPGQKSNDKNIPKPIVLMKMDVEGSELELLTDLLISGALQHVDDVVVEYHPLFETPRTADIKELSKFMQWLSALGPSLNLTSRIKVSPFDDESYFKSNFSLPEC